MLREREVSVKQMQLLGEETMRRIKDEIALQKGRISSNRRQGMVYDERIFFTAETQISRKEKEI